MIFEEVIVVIELGGTGPTQSVIAVLDLMEPSGLYILSVPQKANEVLTEPVVLFICKVKVLLKGAPGVQAVQMSPDKVAPTNSRSFEVHEVLGSGTVWAYTDVKNMEIRKTVRKEEIFNRTCLRYAIAISVTEKVDVNIT